MDNQQFLGIVEGGKFQLLDPPEAHDSFRFTTISMQEARSPESAELDLSGYEDKAIIIDGVDSGGWVYEAAIVDQAGPILTRVIRKVFETGTAARGMLFLSVGFRKANQRSFEKNHESKIKVNLEVATQP